MEMTFSNFTLLVLGAAFYFIVGAFTAGRFCKNHSYDPAFLKIIILLFFPIFSFIDMCKTIFNVFYKLGAKNK